MQETGCSISSEDRPLPSGQCQRTWSGHQLRSLRAAPPSFLQGNLRQSSSTNSYRSYSIDLQKFNRKIGTKYAEYYSSIATKQAEIMDYTNSIQHILKLSKNHVYCQLGITTSLELWIFCITLRQMLCLTKLAKIYCKLSKSSHSQAATSLLFIQRTSTRRMQLFCISKQHSGVDY